MRKLFYVLWLTALALIGGSIFWLTMWWLTSSGGVSINVLNHSHRFLDNVVVSGTGFQSRPATMGAGYGPVVLVEPRFTVHVRLAFDADGKHYDLPASLHMLPVGDYIAKLTIDEEMRISASVRPLIPLH